MRRLERDHVPPLLVGDGAHGGGAESGRQQPVVPRGLATALEVAATIASMPRAGVRTTLGFLSMQEDMAKKEALRWADLAPEYMGLRLRPLADAAARFQSRDRDRDG